jgi:hypothetical protein
MGKALSQITLCDAEGRVHRAWIGLSGNAKQRRLHVRKFKRAGFHVRRYSQ